MPPSTSTEALETSGRPILLYDGVCGFCHGLVQFILRRDRQERFVFAAIQSDTARAAIERHGRTVDVEHPDTVYVLLSPGGEDERLIDRSRAAAFILTELGGPLRLVGFVLRCLPRTIADWAYDRFASVRYRLFGRLERCALPTPAERARFLDVEVPPPPRARDVSS